MQVAGTGRIDLIIGPMFAGKTTKLLRLIERAERAHSRCVLLKYTRDTRYSEEKVSTHDNAMHTAIPCMRLMDTIEVCRSYDLIGIDEGQFFPDVVEFCETLANKGKTIIVAGLDGDFLRRPFGKILELISKCESVSKLSAICTETGREAAFTKRTIENSEIEVIGGAEMYRAACRASFAEQGRDGGEIHLTLGPVSSGKTTEVMRILNRHHIASRKVVLITHEKSHKISGKRPRHTVIQVSELPKLDELTQYDVIGVDDGHLFTGIAEWADKLANSGKQLEITALDGDKNQNAFANIIELLPKCEKVQKLDSICPMTCLPAPFTVEHGTEIIPVSRMALLQIHAFRLINSFA